MTREDGEELRKGKGENAGTHLHTRALNQVKMEEHWGRGGGIALSPGAATVASPSTQGPLKYHLTRFPVKFLAALSLCGTVLGRRGPYRSHVLRCLDPCSRLSGGKASLSGVSWRSGLEPAPSVMCITHLSPEGTGQRFMSGTSSENFLKVYILYFCP